MLMAKNTGKSVSPKEFGRINLPAEKEIEVILFARRG